MLSQVSLVLAILCSQAHFALCNETDSLNLFPADIVHLFEPTVVINELKKFLEMSTDLSTMFKCLGKELGNCTLSKQSPYSHNTDSSKSSKKTKQFFSTSHKQQDSSNTTSNEHTNPTFTSHVVGSNTKSPFASTNHMGSVHKSYSKLNPIRDLFHEKPKATESSTSASVTNTLIHITTPDGITTLPPYKTTDLHTAPQAGLHSTKYVNFHKKFITTTTTTSDKSTYSHKVPKDSYLPTTTETSTQQSNIPPKHTTRPSRTTKPTFSHPTTMEDTHKNCNEFSVSSTSSPNDITGPPYSTKLPHSHAYSRKSDISTVSTESSLSTKTFENTFPITSLPICKKESSFGTVSLTNLADNLAEHNIGDDFSEPCTSSPIENYSPVRHTTPRVAHISSHLPESSSESIGSVHTSTTHGHTNSPGSSETPVTGIEPHCFPCHFTLDAAPVFDNIYGANRCQQILPMTWNHFNKFYSNLRYMNPLNFGSVSSEIPQLSFPDNIPSEFFGSLDGSTGSGYPFPHYSTSNSYLNPPEWSFDLRKPQKPFRFDRAVVSDDFYHYPRLFKGHTGFGTYSSPFYSGNYFGVSNYPWSCLTSEGASYIQNPVLPGVSTEFPNPFYSHG